MTHPITPFGSSGVIQQPNPIPSTGADTMAGVGAGIFAQDYTDSAPPRVIAPVAPKFATLVDDFTNGLDTTKWTLTGTASVSGGQVVLPMTTAYPALISGFYDLTGSAVYAKVTPQAQPGAGSREFFFEVLNQAVGPTNKLSMFQSGSTTLTMRITRAGTNTSVGTVAWDAVNMAYWRIRESAGTAFFDTSPDGVTWTNRGSVVHNLTLTHVLLNIDAGYYSGTETADTAFVDNVNAVSTSTAPPTLVAVYGNPTPSASEVTSVPSTTSTTLTASWAAGDTLIAVVASDNNATNTLSAPTATGLTFASPGTPSGMTTASSTSVQMWSATAAAAATNATVTFTQSGAYPHDVTVYRFSGATAVGTPVFKVNSTTSADTGGLASVTTGRDHSAIVYVAADWVAASYFTPTFATTDAGAFSVEHNIFVSTSYASWGGVYTDAGAAGTKSVGLSNGSGMRVSYYAIEVQGVTTAGSGTPATATGGGITLDGTATGTAATPATAPTGAITLGGSSDAAGAASTAPAGSVSLAGGSTGAAPAGATTGSVSLAGGTPIASASTASTGGSVTLAATANPAASVAAAGLIVLGGTTTARAGSSSTGSVTLSGSAAAQATTSSTGSVTLSGTAAAASSSAGSAAGSISLAGGGTGAGSTTSTGSISLAGTAAAQVAGQAGGSITLSGSAAARAASTGTGSITLTGNAAAQAPVTASGSIVLAGSSVAQAPGAATGSIALSGTATARAASTATGNITLAGTATGVPPGNFTFGAGITLGGAGAAKAAAQATGLVTLAAAPAGSGAAAAAGGIVLGGLASGGLQKPSTAAGSLTLGAAAAGRAAATTTGGITLAGTGGPLTNASAFGFLTLAGPATARASTTATGSITLGGAATGVLHAVAIGAIALNGLATGQAAGAARDITLLVGPLRTRTLAGALAIRALRADAAIRSTTATEAIRSTTAEVSGRSLTATLGAI